MSFSLFYIFFTLFLSFFSIPRLSARLNYTTNYFKTEPKLCIFWSFHGCFPYQNSIFHPYFPTFHFPFYPSQTNFLPFYFSFLTTTAFYLFIITSSLTNRHYNLHYTSPTRNLLISSKILSILTNTPKSILSETSFTTRLSVCHIS